MVENRLPARQPAANHAKPDNAATATPAPRPTYQAERATGRQVQQRQRQLVARDFIEHADHGNTEYREPEDLGVRRALEPAATKVGDIVGMLLL